MATFVLVQGGWGGGWQWRFVAPLLRAAGHEVYTPTLTGLGERHHLSRERIRQLQERALCKLRREFERRELV